MRFPSVVLIMTATVLPAMTAHNATIVPRAIACRATQSYFLYSSIYSTDQTLIALPMILNTIDPARIVLQLTPGLPS